MAGIYLHIPFCRKLCYYCDFHFSVSLKQKDRVVNALGEELRKRAIEFRNESVRTIYFGGGTPSVLSAKEISGLLEIVKFNYSVADNPEITLEANPDDLTTDYLKALRNETAVNRFSIGTQSFNDTDLELMNRRHTANQAYESISNAYNAGFTNLNIDLIYGVPGMSIDTWKQNLETFASLGIPHLSAYHLTFEPRTVFDFYRRKGKLFPIDEDLSVSQFSYLLSFMRGKGYDHYEISNFALPGFYSQHNLGYWTAEPYLGIGPSAHSFINGKRRWNVAVNTKYCQSMESGTSDYFGEETPDTRTSYNDYVLTALRTKWGIKWDYIAVNMGKEYLDYCRKQAAKFVDTGKLISTENELILSDDGKFIADHIISGLLMV